MWPLFLLFAASLTPLAQAPAVPDAKSADEKPASIATAQGHHFIVVAHFDSQAAADAALAIAESVAAPAATVYGLVDTGTRSLRAIHLYATTAARDSDVERMRRGDWGHSAFENDSYMPELLLRFGRVAIDPLLDPSVIAAVGLPPHMRVPVARAAAHVYAITAPDRARMAPYWFVEGAARWAAEEGLAAGGWIKNRPEEPTLSMDILRLRQLFESGQMPPLEGIVKGLPGGLTSLERPAVAAHVFRFLKDPSRAAVLARLLEGVRTFDGSRAGEARMAKALGDDAERAALEKAFTESFAAWAPRWQEDGPALSSSEGSLFQCAGPDTNARAWRMESALAAQYVVEGEFEILPVGPLQMNVLLAGETKGFVQVSFVAYHGIDVFRFDRDKSPKEQWTKLATVEVKGLDAGRSIPFRVAVDGALLTVSISGIPACTATLDAKAAAGRWGLGVQAGSAGWWRKIAIGRL